MGRHRSKFQAPTRNYLEIPSVKGRFLFGRDGTPVELLKANATVNRANRGGKLACPRYTAIMWRRDSSPITRPLSLEFSAKQQVAANGTA